MDILILVSCVLLHERRSYMSDQLLIAGTGRATFPLSGKVPALPEWQNTPVHSRQIKGNYGIVLQDADLVIDFDPRNGGRDGMKELERVTGVSFDQLTAVCPITLSGRGDGGCHIWMSKPPDVRVQKQIRDRFPGLDFLSRGTYVVGPGSIHPDTGKPYIMKHILPYRKHCPMVPQALLDAVEKPDYKVTKAPELVLSDAAIEAARIGYLKYLNAVDGAMEGQGGDEYTYRIAQRGYDFGLPPNLTFECMVEWNKKCSPPWSEGELMTKVHNAYSYSRDTAGAKNVVALLESDLPAQIAVIEDFKNRIRKAGERSVEGYRLRHTPESAQAIGYDEKDEIGNSELFIAKHYTFEGKYGLIHHNGVFYQWDGQLWRVVSGDKVRHQIHAAMSRTYKSQQKVENTYRSVRTIVEQDFCPNPHALVFANGTFDTEIHEFRPNRMSDHQIFAVPYDYDPLAECPRFMRFLDEIFEGQPEHEANLMALQEWCGYLLRKDNSYQKMGIFVGVSRSGKGTLATAISDMLGKDNVGGTSLEQLANAHGTQHLHDKKLVTVGDAQQMQTGSRFIAKEILLSVTGNDSITINPKNKTPFTTKAVCRIIIMANELPTMNDAAGALVNRMLIWKFRNSFSGKENFDLNEELRTELAGIFNWALVGLMRLERQRKFTIPHSMHDELRVVRLRNNPIELYVEEYLEWDADSEILISDLYHGTYIVFCHQRGRRPEPLATWVSAMDVMILSRYGGTAGPMFGAQDKIFRGIKLKGSKQ